MGNEEFSQDDFFREILPLQEHTCWGLGYWPSEMPFPVARESSGQLFHSEVKVSGSTGRVNPFLPIDKMD